MRKNIAVLLAGGRGRRLGAEKPKQFLKLAEKTVLEHSLNAFQTCDQIDEIIIISHADFVQEAEKIVSQTAAAKVKDVLPGGRERYDSSLAALAAYEGESVNFVFHDAVRPAVSVALIDKVCAALETHEAVNVVLPAIDTMIEVDDCGKMISLPDRSRLRRVQTPQAFRSETIREAYRRALLDPSFCGTDDCGVVFRYLPETEIALVEGEESNIKLTYPEDIATLELHLSRTRRQ